MTAILQHTSGAPAAPASSLQCPCGMAVLRVVCVDGGFLLIDPEPIDHGPVLAEHLDGQLLARLRSMRHDPTTSAPSWAVHRCRRLEGWVSRPARPVGSPLAPTQLRCPECHNPLPALLVDLGHLTHPTCARDDTYARAAMSWSAQTYLAVTAAPHLLEDL